MTDEPSWGKCKTCRFYSSPGLAGWGSGDCRRHAPTQDGNNRWGLKWPHIHEPRSTWCGDYEAYTPSPDDMAHFVHVNMSPTPTQEQTK